MPLQALARPARPANEALQTLHAALTTAEGYHERQRRADWRCSSSVFIFLHYSHTAALSIIQQLDCCIQATDQLLHHTHTPPNSLRPSRPVLFLVLFLIIGGR